MNYRGRIKGNIVVFETDTRIPEGAEVVITLVGKNRLAEYAGILPSEEVDEMRRLLTEIRPAPVESKPYRSMAEIAH